MQYEIRKRQNPLNRGESKYYASPAYGEEIDVHALASDISKSSQYIFPATPFVKFMRSVNLKSKTKFCDFLGQIAVLSEEFKPLSS